MHNDTVCTEQVFMGVNRSKTGNYQAGRPVSGKKMSIVEVMYGWQFACHELLQVVV